MTNAYQFSNTLTWTKGRHTLKFGTDIRYNKVYNQSDFNSKGNFTFNSLQDYMNNTAFQLQQALQTASWDATQWQNFFFVQDDFRVTPDLTLNLGLRYELSNVPLGMFGATDAAEPGGARAGPGRRRTRTTGRRASASPGRPRSSNSFLGDGKTVFRGGFGMGYDVLFYNLLTVNASNFPRVVDGRRQRTCMDVYPNLLPAGGAPVFDPLAAYTNSPADTQNPDSQVLEPLDRRARSATSWSRWATRAAGAATASTRSTPTRRSDAGAGRAGGLDARTRTRSRACRRAASSRSSAPGR